MSKSTNLSSVIIDLPYARHNPKDFEEAIESEARSMSRDNENVLMSVSSDSTFEQQLARNIRYILHYPTVYIVHYKYPANKYSKKSQYTVYVGETNSITDRTQQHIDSVPEKSAGWQKLIDLVHQDSMDVKQYVIGHEHFNKSLTLDIENKLMSYLPSVPSVSLALNKRNNPQDDYYTADELDKVFSQIWAGLHKEDPELFPSESLIRDSALFKASPFTKLNDEQKQAESKIIETVKKIIGIEDDEDDRGNSLIQTNASYVKQPTHKNNNKAANDGDPTYVIIVQGMAGTGKTVLLSHLFDLLCTQLHIAGPIDSTSDKQPYKNSSTEERMRSYMIVNHAEQENVYNQIALKLGLQKKQGQVVVNATRFINRFSNQKLNNKTGKYSGRALPDEPNGRADIVLIDEAHLLRTQGNQGYSGTNQLKDILKRTKIAIVVFDPEQVLHSSQYWTREELDFLQPSLTDQSEDSVENTPFRTDSFHGESYQVARIRLHEQMRVQADDKTCAWLDEFTSNGTVAQLDLKPSADKSGDFEDSKGFHLHVFESPNELYQEILEKSQERGSGAEGKGLSRLLATYDWEYSSKTKNTNDAHGRWNVELCKDSDGKWHTGLGNRAKGAVNQTFSMPWNYELYPEYGGKKTDAERGAWAERDFTIHEIGSTYTIQGFDLNYAGVIIGPSVIYRNGNVQFDPKNSKDKYAVQGRHDATVDPCENLKHQLNVLLKRGVHGLYLFAVDEQLQQKLLEVINAC
ncbi:hypothetical protein KIM372_05310 [Bombiscardovia nodaiensis]|uniref:Schlafen group 3-like DNA/RNA helicase domain-containing protein n=1 Tax=Bombiscardovia nodaiensis TaxID=2932181 RepID=A0ABM8B705_9BIFI|nr:hypothetical protein KIM372_05310 [Bombiscardovia nodaiensis]